MFHNTFLVWFNIEGAVHLWQEMAILSQGKPENRKTGKLENRETGKYLQKVQNCLWKLQQLDSCFGKMRKTRKHQKDNEKPENMKKSYARLEKHKRAIMDFDGNLLTRSGKIYLRAFLSWISGMALSMK